MDKAKIEKCYEKLMQLDGEEMMELVNKIPFNARLSMITVGLHTIHDEYFDTVQKEEG